VFSFIVLTCFSPVYADRGLIPVEPDVTVYEPGQKAILAWNGHVEIMILSTDVVSSQQTVVLEILPLPSEPTVEAGRFQSFQAIQTLIWNEGRNQFTLSGDNDVRSGSVEIVFHEEIGAHNITVVKASDTSELSEWMDTFLKDSDVDDVVSLGIFETVVEDYMTRGFHYYVLDLITVSPEDRSVDPIVYKFTTDFLYYPLVITSPVGGDTEITLFVLTDDQVTEDYLPFQKVNYRFSEGAWQPIEFLLSKGDLNQIDAQIGALFQYKAWLTILKYDGKVTSLNKDLMLSGYTPTEPTITVEVSLSPLIIALAILLGAASTVAGVIITFILTRI
jgi:hypothetical protein